jgi:hypothetical protein
LGGVALVAMLPSDEAQRYNGGSAMDEGLIYLILFVICIVGMWLFDLFDRDKPSAPHDPKGYQAYQSFMNTLAKILAMFVCIVVFKVIVWALRGCR